MYLEIRLYTKVKGILIWILMLTTEHFFYMQIEKYFDGSIKCFSNNLYIKINLSRLSPTRKTPVTIGNTPVFICQNPVTPVLVFVMIFQCVSQDTTPT